MIANDILFLVQLVETDGDPHLSFSVRSPSVLTSFFSYLDMFPSDYLKALSRPGGPFVEGFYLEITPVVPHYDDYPEWVVSNDTRAEIAAKQVTQYLAAQGRKFLA